MSIGMFIYLASIADALNAWVFIFALISGIGLVVAVTGLITSLENAQKEDVIFWRRVLKYLFPPFFLFIMGSILIPSSNTLYMIAGASVATDAVEEMSPELNKVRSILNEKLDELVEDTEGE
jgi:hypothetical protein